MEIILVDGKILQTIGCTNCSREPITNYLIKGILVKENLNNPLEKTTYKCSMGYKTCHEIEALKRSRQLKRQNHF